MTAARYGDDEPDLDVRVRAAAALRRAGHALVGHHHERLLMQRVADVVEELCDELEGGPERSRSVSGFQRHRDEPAPADGERLHSNIDRPYSGEGSPLGLEPVIHRRGEWAVAEVVLGSAHEGAPARSHGGVVAAMFDDLFGFVLQIHQVGAFTGTLSIRYRAGTPLHTPIRFRCRLVSREGRKLTMEGELHDGEELVATAEALFIEYRSDQLSP